MNSTVYITPIVVCQCVMLYVACITWYITYYCIPYMWIISSDKTFEDRPDLNILLKIALKIKPFV